MMRGRKCLESNSSDRKTSDRKKSENIDFQLLPHNFLYYYLLKMVLRKEIRVYFRFTERSDEYRTP